MDLFRVAIMAFFQIVAGLGILLAVYASTNWPSTTFARLGITDTLKEVVTVPAVGLPVFMTLAGVLICTGSLAGATWYYFRASN